MNGGFKPCQTLLSQMQAMNERAYTLSAHFDQPR